MIVCSRLTNAAERSDRAIFNSSQHVILHFDQDSLYVVVVALCRLVYRVRDINLSACSHVTGKLGGKNLSNDRGDDGKLFGNWFTCVLAEDCQLRVDWWLLQQEELY